MRRAFAGFVEFGLLPGVISGTVIKEIAEWTVETLSETQDQIQRMLGRLVDAGQLRRGEQGLPLQTVTFEGLQMTPAPVARGRPPLILVGGPASDVFWFQFMNALRMVGLDRIMRCAAPDCDRLFVKVGRREYCSTRCQKRIYMRTSFRRKLPPNIRRRSTGKERSYVKTTRTRRR
jgi:hypothetical protein